MPTHTQDKHHIYVRCMLMLSTPFVWLTRNKNAESAFYTGKINPGCQELIVINAVRNLHIYIQLFQTTGHYSCSSSSFFLCLWKRWTKKWRSRIRNIIFLLGLYYSFACILRGLWLVMTFLFVALGCQTLTGCYGDIPSVIVSYICCFCTNTFSVYKENIAKRIHMMVLPFIFLRHVDVLL